MANSVITVDYQSGNPGQGPSWLTRLTGLLYTQFRSKTTWLQWVSMLAQQIQDLENAGQSLFTLLDIDNSTGRQLDVIGRLVGQPRLGTVDALYRRYLYAQIAVNLSAGGPEDLYVFAKALFGSSSTFRVWTDPLGVKIVVLHINTPTDRTTGVVGASFLAQAKEAGSRALLEWQESASSVLFTYDGTAAQAYDVGVYAAAMGA